MPYKATQTRMSYKYVNSDDNHLSHYYQIVDVLQKILGLSGKDFKSYAQYGFTKTPNQTTVVSNNPVSYCFSISNDLQWAMDVVIVLTGGVWKKL